MRTKGSPNRKNILKEAKECRLEIRCSQSLKDKLKFIQENEKNSDMYGKSYAYIIEYLIDLQCLYAQLII